MTKNLFGGSIKSALIHAATAYDRRQEAAADRRGEPRSHYALAHYLRAVDEIMELIDAGASVETAITTATCDRLAMCLLKAVLPADAAVAAYDKLGR